jgi:uncharacterized protein (DUF58 family)
MWQFLKNIYLSSRLSNILIGLIFLFVVSFAFPVLFYVAQVLLYFLLLVLIYDIIQIFQKSKGIVASRSCAERFSNGDENPVLIHIENRYAFNISLEIIDEVPVQFQMRNLKWLKKLASGTTESFVYNLCPSKRGEYVFGTLNVYAKSHIGLISRRYRFDYAKNIAVYPSFLQMKKFELAAFSTDLSELGIKKVRKIGRTLEFEQIKHYVQGDDPRTINWKASARRNELMINQYVDEKSQQVYSIIDKGRLMRMPFNDLSLLDYAINAALVISNIAIKKEDKAGLITFSNKMSSVVSAGKRSGQIYKIQEALYKQRTHYKESNFELLSVFVNRKINHRSLLLLYTNFESYASFDRQLLYFKHLARKHLLVVIFFENTGLKDVINRDPEDIRSIYHQTIAEQFELDKRKIVKELAKFGIYAILTPPENLTVNTINKYLELKARGVF